MALGRGEIFYPLILATLPVVLLYAENVGEAISPLEVFISFICVIATTAFLILSLKLFIKDSAKVSVIISLLLVIFFAYGMIHDFLEAKSGLSIAGIAISSHGYMLPISGIVAAGGVSLTILYRGNLALLMQLMAFIAVALVIFNLGRVGMSTLGTQSELLTNSPMPGVEEHLRPESGQLPDIYFIILDSYGRADVLEGNFGFDNSGFTDFLVKNGFYVANESRSNYVHTHLSLAASLNMRYPTESENAGEMVKQNDVSRLLQKAGYQYVHFGSGWAITKRSKHADVEVLFRGTLPLLLNEFSAALVRRTIAVPLTDLIRLDLDSAYTANYAKRFHYNMAALRQIPEIPGPTFTFYHVFQPHPPFIFDRDGNLPQGSRMELTAGAPNDNVLYIDQLVYVNKNVSEVVDDLLARSPEEPIIIIQGDHGPYPSDSSSFGNPSDRFINERTAILSAYYLPEHCNSDVYPSISPVNAFRLIFDNCLGTKIGLLADESYWETGGPPIDFSQTAR